MLIMLEVMESELSSHGAQKHWVAIMRTGKLELGDEWMESKRRPKEGWGGLLDDYGLLVFASPGLQGNRTGGGFNLRGT